MTVAKFNAEQLFCRQCVYTSRHMQIYITQIYAKKHVINTKAVQCTEELI